MLPTPDRECNLWHQVQTYDMGPIHDIQQTKQAGNKARPEKTVRTNMTYK